ncbi:hypothetical protein VULLAG_LOCUS20820 [Vulpes lagopus]|uniref:uncharacterized protein LOC121500677 isoform X2 n=1 Tax=Vulpes lagopus TaxID=494514 RepID=UPI001BC9DCBF|nr:uncharacterized protein LOC121500677 isoform X2 [Vulpes lagopus]
MPLHKAPLSRGQAPHGGVLLLEVFFSIAGQVRQAYAQSGRQQHGHQQEDPGLRAHLLPSLPKAQLRGTSRQSVWQQGLADSCLSDGEAGGLGRSALSPTVEGMPRGALCALPKPSQAWVPVPDLAWRRGVALPGPRAHVPCRPGVGPGMGLGLPPGLRLRLRILCPGLGLHLRLHLPPGVGCNLGETEAHFREGKARCSNWAASQEAATGQSAQLLHPTVGWRIPRLQLLAREVRGADGEHAF